jgi:hypothetical protein
MTGFGGHPVNTEFNYCHLRLLGPRFRGDDSFFYCQVSRQNKNTGEIVLSGA